MKRVATDRERTCRLCGKRHSTPHRAKRCCPHERGAGTDPVVRRARRYQRAQRGNRDYPTRDE